jgi:hypothetical protein
VGVDSDHGRRRIASRHVAADGSSAAFSISAHASRSATTQRHLSADGRGVFLLLRLLFRRRAVAVVAAVLVLADGMMFVSPGSR